jgi:hypothetical protein
LITAETPVSPFNRQNHYTPQGYLRGWSSDGSHVWAYRLLVPRPDYPEWEWRALKSVASHQDLYTSVRAGRDSDEFEQWLNEEIENPASAALDKVRADQPLTQDDWRRLAYYVAALDIRTPASYVEQTTRWNQQLPGLLKGIMDRLEDDLRAAKKKKKFRQPPSQMPMEGLPIRVTTEKVPESRKVAVRAEVTIGRELWLSSMKHLLTSTAQVLLQHTWCILRPHPGSLWFTSDHPVLRLNYYEEDKYDFGGGWGNPGSEIIVPLSPTHLMYTKVGSRQFGDGTLSLEMTVAFQRLLAERAHRWIFALGQPKRAVWFHPRRVDLSAFKQEVEAWRAWHDEQRAAETA